VKMLLIAAALTAAAVVPVAAQAADPNPADFKNAAQFCKAFKAAADSSNFATMFGTKKNAYGKCVSTTAKQHANKDAKQEEAAKSNAAQECKAELGDSKKGGKNAFGKCVSAKAKANKEQADEAEAAKGKDRINAARSCKQAKKADADAFAEEFGTKKNAFGKCVSTTAHEMAAAREQESGATT
jgi:hypothetical protein